MHNLMLEFMTEDQVEQLHESNDGNAFLQKLTALPIVMIQVHCLELKIAVLDRPYWVYYRIRVLETFTIPLTPLESLEML